ncbi:hypothetical protein [Sphingomonas pokkalii]|nr:hypothetical protein [Sphingomonas pokkalii]
MRGRSLGMALPMLAALFAAAPLRAQDSEGQDHAALPRYPGAIIDGYRAPSLDEIVLPTGPVTNETAQANLAPHTGQVTHIDYRLTPATAPLQIERYYTGLFQKQGFKTVYACVGPACGAGMGGLILNSGRIAPTGLADGLFNDRIRVLVARRGDTWVLLHIAEGPDRSQIYEAVLEGQTDTADR